MNSSQRRSIMFGEKAVIEMDIDPFVSNLDTPADIKVPTTVSKYVTPILPQQGAAVTTISKAKAAEKKVQKDDEKKENDASEIEEPVAKKKR
ncbi:unnamed protein product [Caenorhabditis sp. 36 PRJEB53466]|nr:unnamed protein product [Caenorhabditis sp. 36 PRJEB53466]